MEFTDILSMDINPRAPSSTLNCKCLSSTETDSYNHFTSILMELLLMLELMLADGDSGTHSRKFFLFFCLFFFCFARLSYLYEQTKLHFKMCMCNTYHFFAPLLL